MVDSLSEISWYIHWLWRGERDSNPRGKTHRISNPTQWPGYAIAANIRPTLQFEIKQTVAGYQLKKSWKSSSKSEEDLPPRFAKTLFIRFLFLRINGNPMKLIMMVSSIIIPAIWKSSICM